MGLFDRFTKSFEDKVNEAIKKMRTMNLGVEDLGADVAGKIVTLTGTAESKEAKFKAMEVFNNLVDTGNTVNTISVAEAPAAPEPAAADMPAEPDTGSTHGVRIHEVVAGDTLGALAQKYYGKASSYMTIFEANRDILDNPDLIKVGQKLRIPD